MIGLSYLKYFCNYPRSMTLFKDFTAKTALFFPIPKTLKSCGDEIEWVPENFAINHIPGLRKSERK